MEVPKRKSAKLKGYNYSKPGMYFLTICVKGRKHLLGKIVGCGDFDALEAGAEDFSPEEGYFEIVTAPEDFSAVNDALADKYTFTSAEITMVPQNYIKLTDEEDIKLMNKLLDMLEDNDDVQNVYHNWEMDEEN